MTRRRKSFDQIRESSLPSACSAEPILGSESRHVKRDIWPQLMQQRNQHAVTFRQLAEQGLTLLAAETEDRQARLQEMRDFYVFVEEETAGILARWEERRKKQQ